MQLTILSHTETIKAVVTATDHEITAAYYRRNCGPAAGWQYLRTTTLPGPFHLALNTVHALVNAAGTR